MILFIAVLFFAGGFLWGFVLAPNNYDVIEKYKVWAFALKEYAVFLQKWINDYEKELLQHGLIEEITDFNQHYPRESDNTAHE